MTEEEQTLSGGNSGIVVRVGNTVRKTPGDWTPRVHQLMSELRDAGLDFVPEPRGYDDRGREVLEFVEGDVPVYPMPEWVWSDDLLVDVGQMLRRLHDATAELTLPADGWRRPAIQPTEVICHGDVAPYNTVIRGGRLIALIDWDHARPAPRGWDLGYTAYRWVSLTPRAHPDGHWITHEERDRRLRLLCDAYGDADPHDVVRWAVVRLRDLVAFARERADSGDSFARATIAAGHSALYTGDADWLEATYPKAVVAAGYDAIAERYAAWGSTKDGVKSKYVARALELGPPGGDALDLGCGTGHQVTRYLAERYTVTGVDISPRSIELARGEVPAASFLVGDMASVSMPDQAFDVVTAFFSLIHVPRGEHLDVLRRIRGWLRPGGHVIVTMAAGSGGEDRDPDWLGTAMYWSSWDAVTNRELVVRAGLEAVDVAEETEDEDGVPVTSLWITARRP